MSGFFQSYTKKLYKSKYFSKTSFKYFRKINFKRGKTGYDDHIFGVNANDSDFVLVNDLGWIKKKQDNYVVRNIGRAKVLAELWHGNKLKWFESVSSATVKPGEIKTLYNEGKYNYTGLRIINLEKTRAIVHSKGGYLRSPQIIPKDTYNLYKILPLTFTYCVKYFVSYDVSVVFKDMFVLYWYIKEPNIWEKVSKKIYPLLDENNKSTIRTLLENEVNVCRDKIMSLICERDNKIKMNEHFMALAYDLIGLERKFQFSDNIKNHHNINLCVLPMLFNVVSLKMHFYLVGLKYANELGLSKDNVLQIKKYATDTFKNALNYIELIEKKSIDHVYKSSEVQGIFDNLMTVRSHLAIHGQEYLPIWKYQLENPLSNDEIYNPVISYSTFFGKSTPNLCAQATGVSVTQPLCPKIINGKRNKLKEVLIYLWHGEKIGGVKLLFENGDEYNMGTITNLIQSFELNEAKIVEITAYGEGKIDGLHFLLSNGRKKTFGQTTSNSCQTFSRKDHHIPSFYLSSDSRDLDGQAANIAVSFQWYVTPHTASELPKEHFL